VGNKIFSAIHDDDELAAVMAHEMGHLVLGHTADSIKFKTEHYISWCGRNYPGTPECVDWTKDFFASCGGDNPKTPECLKKTHYLVRYVRYEPDNEAYIALSQQHEKDADRVGIKIIKAINDYYKVEKYKQKMGMKLLHYKDYTWAMKKRVSVRYPSLDERAHDAQQEIRQACLGMDWAAKLCAQSSDDIDIPK